MVDSRLKKKCMKIMMEKKKRSYKFAIRYLHKHTNLRLLAQMLEVEQLPRVHANWRSAFGTQQIHREGIQLHAHLIQRNNKSSQCIIRKLVFGSLAYWSAIRGELDDVGVACCVELYVLKRGLKIIDVCNETILCDVPLLLFLTTAKSRLELAFLFK